MNERKPVIATAGQWQGRPVELREGEECTVHSMMAPAASDHLRTHILDPKGVDACRDCLERVRSYLQG